ncbi:MAG: GNAT family N-acetyltransferase [Rubripirellula sp.]|nr:GNAT family N-acetyltransferase [Rubripirellula sp.]
MSFQVIQVPVQSDTAIELISELESELRRDYPPHYIHDFDLAAFDASQGIFMISYCGDVPMGCLALRPLEKSTAELKRMFVRPSYRGQGAARIMLVQMEQLATDQGFTQIVLETGNRQLAAIRLYRSSGYAPIEPYSEQTDGPASVCFRKALCLETEFTDSSTQR